MELKDIVGYLPHELKGIFNVEDVFAEAPYEKRIKKLRTANVDFFMDFCKPILKPLSSLTKEALREYYQDLTDYHLECIKKDIIERPLHQNYTFTGWLLSKHFDINGLIERGEAVDFNTLQKDK